MAVEADIRSVGRPTLPVSTLISWILFALCIVGGIITIVAYVQLRASVLELRNQNESLAETNKTLVQKTTRLTQKVTGLSTNVSHLCGSAKDAWTAIGKMSSAQREQVPADVFNVINLSRTAWCDG